MTAREQRYIANGLLVADGKVLLLRRRADRHGAGQWDIPGGKVEAGEDPARAVAREFREETGLTVEVQREVIRQTIPDRHDQPIAFVAITYLVRATGPIDEVVVDPDEHDAWRWVAIDAVAEMDVVAHLPPAIARLTGQAEGSG